jgi:hypothetical protein
MEGKGEDKKNSAMINVASDTLVVFWCAVHIERER